MTDESTRIWIEVNGTIYFDENNYLRETASDLPMLAESIEALERLLSKAEGSERYAISGALGNLYRIYGNDDATQLAKAKQYLNECLAYATHQEDAIKEMVTLIRSGEVLKYGGEHGEALTLFDKALSLCRSGNFLVYQDFALQHIGKCYLEMHEFECAEKNLQEALDLRRKKGDEALIDSTEKALELVSKLKNKA